MPDDEITITDVCKAPWDRQIIGAYHPLAPDGEPNLTRVVVYLADGRAYDVVRFGAAMGAGRGQFARTLLGGASEMRGASWDMGYQSGFADGANDSGAEMREACEAALTWLEAERDSNEPGATIPGEIIRVLRAALGEES